MLAKPVNGETADEEEKARFLKFKDQWQQMQQAQTVCANNAPLRNMASIRVPYCDVEMVEIKQNEEGEPATNTLSAEQAFFKHFNFDFLEKFASFNV